MRQANPDSRVSILREELLGWLVELSFIATILRILAFLSDARIRNIPAGSFYFACETRKFATENLLWPYSSIPQN